MVEENLIDNLSYKTPIGLSDLTWEMTVIKVQEENHTVKLNYWKGDYNKIGKTLKDMNWTQILENKDANEQWNCLKSILLDAVRENVLSKAKRRSTVKCKNGWMTRTTMCKIKDHGKVWARYKEHQTTINYTEYNNNNNNLVW